MRNGEQELWELAQAAWDERRDPLEDRSIQEWLLARPEHIEELVHLRSALAQLASARPRRRSRRPLASWLCAAALLLGLALLGRWDPEPGEPPVAFQNADPVFEVLRLHVEFRTSSPERETRMVLQEDGWTFSESSCAREPSDDLVVLTQNIQIHSNRPEKEFPR